VLFVTVLELGWERGNLAVLASEAPKKPIWHMANTALANLACLDGLVRAFQHLAVAVRDYHTDRALTAAALDCSLASAKKCQLLLRAALNGCMRAKACFSFFGYYSRGSYRVARMAAHPTSPSFNAPFGRAFY
jgi:hypothetical protein